MIDSHVHPVFGDWTPRQNQLGWIDSTMHGGVTTMISAGEVHLPGRPKDIVGLKALAITAQRAFDNFRPGGVKVLAGAPVIEKGMVESDFAELADAGVKLLGEVGLGSVKAGDEAQRWSPGRASTASRAPSTPAAQHPGLGPDRQGRRARSRCRRHRPHQRRPYLAAGAHVCELCEKSSRGIEIVHNGNETRGHRRREGRDAAEVPAPRDPGHRRARPARAFSRWACCA
jgi:enamidase